MAHSLGGGGRLLDELRGVGVDRRVVRRQRDRRSKVPQLG